MMIIERKANKVSILNINQIDNVAPSRDIYHLDLNTGRYDGSPEKCSKKEIKQIAPQVTIKNMEII